MPGTRHPVLILVLAVATVAAGACTGHSHNATVPADGCAAAFQERLDSRSTIHLFPGAVEPHYLTDPPTSGPHRPGVPYTGVVAAPIPRPSQVAMLENGYIIIQAGALPTGQSAALAALAGTLVTVAPPVTPLPAQVVATAWTWKLECGSAAPPAIGAIQAFIAAHRGVGFAGNQTTTPPSG
jgi:hypothetical protein